MSKRKILSRIPALFIIPLMLFMLLRHTGAQTEHAIGQLRVISPIDVLEILERAPENISSGDLNRVEFSLMRASDSHIEDQLAYAYAAFKGLGHLLHKNFKRVPPNIRGAWREALDHVIESGLMALIKNSMPFGHVVIAYAFFNPSASFAGPTMPSRLDFDAEHIYSTFARHVNDPEFSPYLAAISAPYNPDYMTFAARMLNGLAGQFFHLISETIFEEDAEATSIAREFYTVLFESQPASAGYFAFQVNMLATGFLAQLNERINALADPRPLNWARRAERALPQFFRRHARARHAIDIAAEHSLALARELAQQALEIGGNLMALPGIMEFLTHAVSAPPTEARIETNAHTCLSLNGRDIGGLFFTPETDPLGLDGTTAVIQLLRDNLALSEYRHPDVPPAPETLSVSAFIDAVFRAFKISFPDPIATEESDAHNIPPLTILELFVFMARTIYADDFGQDRAPVDLDLMRVWNYLNRNFTDAGGQTWNGQSQFIALAAYVLKNQMFFNYPLALSGEYFFDDESAEDDEIGFDEDAAHIQSIDFEQSQKNLLALLLPNETPESVLPEDDSTDPWVHHFEHPLSELLDVLMSNDVFAAGLTAVYDEFLNLPTEEDDPDPSATATYELAKLFDARVLTPILAFVDLVRTPGTHVIPLFSNLLEITGEETMPGALTDAHRGQFLEAASNAHRINIPHILIQEAGTEIIDMNESDLRALPPYIELSVNAEACGQKEFSGTIETSDIIKHRVHTSLEDGTRALTRALTRAQTPDFVSAMHASLSENQKFISTPILLPAILSDHIRGYRGNAGFNDFMLSESGSEFSEQEAEASGAIDRFYERALRDADLKKLTFEAYRGPQFPAVYSDLWHPVAAIVTPSALTNVMGQKLRARAAAMFPAPDNDHVNNAFRETYQSARDDYLARTANLVSPDDNALFLWDPDSVHIVADFFRHEMIRALQSENSAIARHAPDPFYAHKFFQSVLGVSVLNIRLAAEQSNRLMDAFEYHPHLILLLRYGAARVNAIMRAMTLAYEALIGRGRADGRPQTRDHTRALIARSFGPNTTYCNNVDSGVSTRNFISTISAQLFSYIYASLAELAEFEYPGIGEPMLWWHHYLTKHHLNLYLNESHGDIYFEVPVNPEDADERVSPAEHCERLRDFALHFGAIMDVASVEDAEDSECPFVIQIRHGPYDDKATLIRRGIFITPDMHSGDGS